MQRGRQPSRGRDTTSPLVGESCTGPPIITPREGFKRRRSLGARPRHPKRKRWGRFSTGSTRRSHQLSSGRGATSLPAGESCTGPWIIVPREGRKRRRSLGARRRHPKRERRGRFSAGSMQRGRQLSRGSGATSPPVGESCTGPRIIVPHEGRKRRRPLGARRRHPKRQRRDRFSAARAWRGHRVCWCLWWGTNYVAGLGGRSPRGVSLIVEIPRGKPLWPS